jgi:hypothetical protein
MPEPLIALLPRRWRIIIRYRQLRALMEQARQEVEDWRRWRQK